MFKLSLLLLFPYALVIFSLLPLSENAHIHESYCNQLFDFMIAFYACIPSILSHFVLRKKELFPHAIVDKLFASGNGKTGGKKDIQTTEDVRRVRKKEL